MLTRYEIDTTIKILENDTELQDILSDKNIVLSDEDFRNLSIILLNNKSTISNNSIDELNQMNPPVARDDIEDLLGVDYISSLLYRQIIYTFKYSTVKIFFRQNYSKFIPDYDFTIINSQSKMKLFTEACMREYDRFTNIIDEIYNIVDVDKAPEKYLNYLAQAVGYEREDSNLLTNVSFRELIKNIVEVYKIKGTNYSFELFFNFLGFQIDLKEFWFDKRYGDPNINNNPETGVSNNKNFLFYLTSIKPTEYIPEGMGNPYAVPENSIIGTLDVNEFNRKISSSEYTPEQLIGDESGYPDQTYTFFKTNVMQYTLRNIKTEEGGEGELSQADLKSIERYANFLTPIFMQKSITVSIKPFEDFAGIIILGDASRIDPRSNRLLNESMLHHYQGYQPKNYYWEDGVHYYNESVLRRDKGGKRPDISNPEGGGHFISGFYKDTTEKISEIRQQIRDANPTYSEKQVSQKLSSMISDKSIFSNNFPDRDLMYPYIEGPLYYPARSIVMKDEYRRNVPLLYKQSFSYRKGEQKRFSEAFNEELDNKTKIISITLDDGDGKSAIYINKLSTYRYISENDTIKIMYTKDKENTGIYEVESVTEEIDSIKIKITEQLNSKQKTSGGFIQIYYQDWKMRDFTFPFFFDRIMDRSVEDHRTIEQSYFSYWFGDYYSKSRNISRDIPESPFLFSFNEFSVTEEDRETFDSMEVEDINNPYTFYNLSTQQFNMSGNYEVTYDATTYIRNSFDFYSNKPYLYSDYIDVAKT